MNDPPSGLPPAPYPGLRPFTKDEWPIFFGRESMTQDVIERLVDRHAVTVHGDSGCGKSSLIAAGVLPMLENDQARSGGTWRTCIMRPGETPLANLARALAEIDRPGDESHFIAVRRLLNRSETAPAALAELLGCGGGHNVCILFDQFEELFEHARREGPLEADLVTAFLASLVEKPPDGLHAILTMRSDYLGQCAQYRGFAEMVNHTQYLVPRMERPALLRAIREPALLYGGEVKPDLAVRLIAEAGTGQDQLPLIQHGLMLLWRRKTGGTASEGWTLDAGDYDSGGNLADLLSAHADQVMADAAPDARARTILEMAFRALIGQTAEGQAIRRRASFAELCAVSGAKSDELQAILAPFRAPGVSFLRPYGTSPLAADAMLDVSHESFIRSWRQLSNPDDGWLARETDDGLKWISYRMEARRFVGDHTALLSAGASEEGGRFLAAHNESWALRHGGDYDSIRTLIDASQHEAEHRRRREARLKWSAIGAAIVMTLLAIFAWQQRAASTAAAARAEENAARAKDNETIGLAALSLNAAYADHIPLEGVKLALAAWPRRGDEGRPRLARTADALGQSLQMAHEQMRLEGHTDFVTSASFSPDSSRIVTASADKTARIWDAATGNLIRTLEGHTDVAYSASFSPDGTRIVTGSWDKTARIWDAATGNLIRTLEGHTSAVYSASFSPDGTRIVTGSADNTARIWDASTGKVIRILEGHTGAVNSASFSPDSTRIVTGSADNTARIWDAATGKLIRTLVGHTDIVYSASFSPDGTRIVAGSWDTTACIWDAATGNLIRSLEGHTGTVYSASFSPDGISIVTGSADNTARIWDASTGRLIRTLEGHTGALASASFSPDGTRIVTGSEDKTARIWDTTIGGLISPLEGHTGDVYSASFSPDGVRIVTGSKDKTARIWKASTGRMIRTLEGHTDVLISASFSPDGTRIVTGSNDKTARIWDAATGNLIRTLEGHTGAVYYASFSPDGARIVTGSKDKTSRIWDAATGNLIRTLEGHTDAVISASFSPDGTRIVTGSWDKTARIWDAATGNLLSALEGHTDRVISASFSPDGTRIVTGSKDNTARIWDASTGDLLRTLEGHTDAVISASFSPDGTRIVTGSLDNTVRVWDAATGSLIHTLEGHADKALSVSFSPDGTRIVIGSADHTARIWDISRLEKGDAFQIACQRLGSNTSLDDVEKRYGLSHLVPICGDNPPLPADLSELK